MAKSVLRTGQHTSAAGAGKHLFPALGGVQKIVKRSRAIHIGVADQVLVRQSMKRLLIQAACLVAGSGQLLKQVIFHTLSGRQASDILRHKPDALVALANIKLYVPSCVVEGVKFRKKSLFFKIVFYGASIQWGLRP